MKLKSLLLSLFIVVAVSFLGHTQTIVSTLPSKKCVFLEQYGGINCPNCASMNAQINDYIANTTVSVLPVSIHAGIYAEPNATQQDFRIPEGEFYATLTGWTSSPAYTINRTNFSPFEQGAQGTNAISGYYAIDLIEEEGQKEAVVNIGAEVDYHIATNSIDIKVEAYYPSEPQTTDHFLNIMVIQNNILGYQEGIGDSYLHQSVLREVLTPVAGDSFSGATQYGFFEWNYSFDLTDVINGIELNPSELEFVVYITEDTTGPILNGHKATVNYILNNENDVAVIAHNDNGIICGQEFVPKVLIQNNGMYPLMSVDFEYGFVTSEQLGYNWEGFLLPFESTYVELPSITIENYYDTILYVEVLNPNGVQDEDSSNNHMNCEIAQAPYLIDPITEEVSFLIRTDNYGYETYWKIVDDADNIIASGGNNILEEYGGGQQVASSSDVDAYASGFVYETMILDLQIGCYKLIIYDDFGDGICCDFGNGFYQLKADNDVMILGGDFTDYIEHEFSVLPSTLTIDSEEIDVKEDTYRIYPSPASDLVLLEVERALDNVVIYSLAGDVVQEMKKETSLKWSTDVSHLSAGTYIVRAYGQESAFTTKIVVIP